MNPVVNIPPQTSPRPRATGNPLGSPRSRGAKSSKTTPNGSLIQVSPPSKPSSQVASPTWQTTLNFGPRSKRPYHVSTTGDDVEEGESRVKTRKTAPVTADGFIDLRSAPSTAPGSPASANSSVGNKRTGNVANHPPPNPPITIDLTGDNEFHTPSAPRFQAPSSMLNPSSHFPQPNFDLGLGNPLEHVSPLTYSYSPHNYVPFSDALFGQSPYVAGQSYAFPFDVMGQRSTFMATPDSSSSPYGTLGHSNTSFINPNANRLLQGPFTPAGPIGNQQDPLNIPNLDYSLPLGYQNLTQLGYPTPGTASQTPVMPGSYPTPSGPSRNVSFNKGKGVAAGPSQNLNTGLYPSPSGSSASLQGPFWQGDDGEMHAIEGYDEHDYSEDMWDSDDSEMQYMGHAMLDADSQGASHRIVQRPAGGSKEISDGVQKLLDHIDCTEENGEARKETPEAMVHPLMPHQKIGLAWMVKMEEKENKGGILADEMGLGKTIQTLALMVARKSEDPNLKTTLILCPIALMYQWKSEIETKLKDRSRHRLSICIVESHTKKKWNWNLLKEFDIVITSYGMVGHEYKKRLDWLSGDPSLPEPFSLFVGERCKWFRVVCDEAQSIKNSRTVGSQGCCDLSAKHRWCLTGTPMQNNLMELHALIKFLRIKPYNDVKLFRTEIESPIKSGGRNRPGSRIEKGMERLHALLKAILLRRTKKSKIDGKAILEDLPDRNVESVVAEFDDDERAFYLAVETHAQIEINRFIKAGTVYKHYSAILVLLLRLRQICCHGMLVDTTDVGAFLLPDGSESTEEIRRVVAAGLEESVVRRIKDTLAEDGGLICPVCMDVNENPRFVSPCGHNICGECMSGLVRAPLNPTGISMAPTVMGAKCPVCRGGITSNVTDLYSFQIVHMKAEAAGTGLLAAAEPEDDADSDSDSDSESDSESDSDLDDFVVNDDESVKYDTDDEEGPREKKPRANRQKAIEAKKENEGKSLLEMIDPDSDSDSDSEPRTSRSKAKSEKNRARTLELYDDKLSDYEPESYKGKSKAKKSKALRKSKSGQKTNSREDSNAKKAEGKGKGKERAQAPRKSKKPPKTLAQLKKVANQNRRNKEKYLKKLAKDYQPSTKINKCVEILEKIESCGTGEKTIVFSQWTTLLDLLEVPLFQKGMVVERYDGSMSMKQRNAAVDRFKAEPTATIMLVSLKAGNAGLNLTEATQVIILDPFWNPYVEEQAINRAHRIGQTQVVNVHRLYIKDSVEDRILKLQEEKRSLIEGALDEDAAKAITQLGLAQLAGLFNINL
ncbi:MAG: hypothetical protein M1814_001118 [Vezdaea aestivalis]|nr:MAG: hypothetical protein M1814_001118 [Vezdaea aestivalis]